jgi:hypothetical protein
LPSYLGIKTVECHWPIIVDGGNDTGGGGTKNDGNDGTTDCVIL